MNLIMKLVKTLLVLVVVIVIVAVVFVSVFDANEYKPEIIAQVEQATGRDFSIDGDIGLTLYPWIGLKLEKTTLGNASGCSDRAFAWLAQLNVKVIVLALLKKRIEINKVQLKGLQLSLEVDKNGNNNWSNLAQAGSATAPASSATNEATGTDEATASGSAEPAFQLDSLNVEGFEFVDARIGFTDGQSGVNATVSDLNLETGAIGFDEPVDVAFRAHVVNNQPALDSQINLTTQLSFNREFTLFDLRDLLLTVAVKANDMVAQDVTLTVKTQVVADLGQKLTTIRQLNVNVLDINTRGELRLSQQPNAPLVQGQVTVEPFNAREVAGKLGVTLPPMASDKALTSVGLSTNIKLKGQRLDLDNFNVQLDSSVLAGWVRVLDLSKQRLRYSLLLDRIDANDYMPPAVEESTASLPATPAGNNGAGTAAAASGDEKIELPLEMLRGLDIQGDFAINALRVKDFDISDMSIATRAKQGVIALDPVRLAVLDGKVDAGVNLDVKKQPNYAVRLKVTEVQAGPVVNPSLKGLMGDKDLSLKGAVNLAANIRTQGETLNSLKRGAKGKITLDMTQTEVNGFDPEYFVRNSVADYLKEKGLGSGDSIRGNYKPREVTVFNVIHDTATIENGNINTKDFLMDSRRVTIKAFGDVDIMKNAVDMTASLKLARNKTVVEKILNEPVYVRVFGPFDKIDYKLDTKKLSDNLGNIAKQEAQQRLNEEKAKLQKKADAEKARLKAKADAEKQRLKEKADKEKQRLQDKLKDKLKNLF